MIIETNINLFYDITNVWNHSARWENCNFFDWLRKQGATVDRSRRKLTPDSESYDDTVILHGIDYIKFESEQDFLLFILRYL